MDPAALAAVGLAANILQFIDWVSQAVEAADDIRNKGTGSAFGISVYDANEVLKYQITRLVADDRISCDTRSERIIQKIAKDCHEIAQKLSHFAKTLDVNNDDRSQAEYNNNASNSKKPPKLKAWERFQRELGGKPSSAKREATTFSKAIRFMWNKKAIDSLLADLDRHRKLLQSEVLVGIRDSTIESIEMIHILSDRQSKHHRENIMAQKCGERVILDTLSQHKDDISQQLASLAQSSRDRELEILKSVNDFVNMVEKGQQYPVLPHAVTDYDPSMGHCSRNSMGLVQTAVLDQLQFRRMRAREAEVKDAYENTCFWIFEETDFSQWLETGKGLYWISGKAGCGKSTLMKLIVNDARTLTHLETWHARSSLITESYFFWMGGSELQKNQEGLLRSLLHGILSKRPALISRAFPDIYKAILTRMTVENKLPNTFFHCHHSGCGHIFSEKFRLKTHLKSSHPISPLGLDDTETYELSENCGHLTLTELKSALLFVAGELPRDIKICLFIDGLDEYRGNHRDIIDLFRVLVERSNRIKAVVSSRPEPIFRQLFNLYPKVQMDQLTRGDIDHYIRSNLFEHQRMHSLVARDEEGTEKLLNTIVVRSCGVFLWIFLITRALLDGLDDGSTLEELHQITEEYPEELQEVYGHMLDRMTSRHRLHGMQLLLCISLAQAVEDSLPSLLRLSFVNQSPKVCLAARLQQNSTEDMEEILERTENRLRNRCCGLIEVASLKGDGAIKLLHRTVAEFLSSMTSMMIEETHKHSFEANAALFSSMIMCFKSWDFFVISPDVSFTDLYSQALKGFFHYCNKINSSHALNPAPYIYEFDRVLTHFWHYRCLENKAVNMHKSYWIDIIPGMRKKRLQVSPSDPLIFVAKQYGLKETLHQYRQELRLESRNEGETCDTEPQMDLIRPPWVRAGANVNYYATSKNPLGKLTKKQDSRQNHDTPKITVEEHQPSPIECTKCAATRRLLELGFSASEVLEALHTAGVGADVSALTAWLLDREMKDITQKGNTSSGYQNHPAQPPNYSKQWSTVVKGPRKLEGVATPGFVIQEKKGKNRSRRPKTQLASEIISSSGELPLNSGKMTWFLDTVELGESPGLKSGLNKADESQLAEFLNKLLAGK